jgi:hypothetical protein
MPNFYAKEVLQKEDKFCFGKHFDFSMRWIYDLMGVCKSMDDYNYKKDSQGRPKISECQKFGFGYYYSSPEAFALFRALYNNQHGIQDKFVKFWVHVSKKFANN